MVDLKKFGFPGIMRRKVKADILDETAETPDVWEEHVSKLNARGVPEPGSMLDPTAKSPTQEDINESLKVSPSFVKRLPWVEFLGDSDAMLLEDNESVAAFFELTEPPRVSRRLQPLRGWSDEKTTEVLPRGP